MHNANHADTDEEPLTHHARWNDREIHLGPVETCYTCNPQRRAIHDHRSAERPGRRPS